MSGEIVFKNGSDVLFSNVPGSETKISTNNIKKKLSDKKINKDKIIPFFDKLAEIETDDIWKERFEKMGKSKFPPKISWISSDPDDESFGKIIYKFRQASKEQQIFKDQSYETNSLIIKTFIKKYTNVSMNSKTKEDFIVIPKGNIVPISWNKLPSKEQVKRVIDFFKVYSEEKNLSDYQMEILKKNLILKTIMGALTSNIDFSKDGTIEHISGIKYDKNLNIYFFE